MKFHASCLVDYCSDYDHLRCGGRLPSALSKRRRQFFLGLLVGIVIGELRGERGKAVVTALGPSILDGDIAPFHDAAPLGRNNTRPSALTCTNHPQRALLQQDIGERSCRRKKREFIPTMCRPALDAKRFKWSKS